MRKGNLERISMFPTLFYRRGFLAALAGAGLLRPTTAADKGWITLFDGRSLNGWHSDGKARWSVEDGTIVGRQGEDGGPGDLFTNAKWKDLELEAEWKMHWPGNSGL